LFRYQENETSQVLFLEGFKVFIGCDVFTPSLAPFSKRTCGPEWFVMEFPTEDIEHQEEINAICKAYLTPIVISSRSSTNTTLYSYGIFGYQPNLVARQFGFIQTHPSSFFETKEDIRRQKNEQQWQTYLHEFDGIVPNFKPIHFKLSYECTRSFFNWWREYFNN
jgi:hypothetical protein